MPGGSKWGTGFSGNRVTDDCGPPCMWWGGGGVNSDSLKKISALNHRPSSSSPSNS